MPDLTVVILAGGSSSRFYPLNSYLDKGNSNLLGEAILDRTLRSLSEAGYKNIVLVTPKPKQEKNNTFNQLVTKHKSQLSISIVTQESSSGMGEAVLLAAPHVKTQQFLIIAPYHTKAGKLSQRLIDLGSSAAIFTTSTDMPWRYGIVTIENNLATGITEKPTKGTEFSDQKVQAIYLLNQNFLDILKSVESEQYSFETALNLLMQREKVGVVKLEKSLPTLKYSWQLFDFMSLFLADGKTKISETAEVASSAVIDDQAGAVIISDSAKIGHAARIVGPCYIGPKTLVGDFSLVRQSNIEANVTVGANTEVVRSIIFENTTIHYSYLADSILGKDNKIAAGLITANKRFDRQSIKTKVGGKTVDTGCVALGIITGSNVTTGVGVRTMPGVLIADNQVVLPGTLVQKNIDKKVED
jgi:NDP-sugar pyrophosphorylase family protein